MNIRRAGQQSLMIPILIICTASCGPVNRNASTIAPAAERQILEAVLDTLQATQRVAVRLDPRVLSGHPDVPRTDLRHARINWIELAPADEAQIRLRSELAAARNLQTVDILDRSQCSEEGGTVMPGQPIPRRPSQVCMLLSSSRSGGPYYPARNIDERQSGSDRGYRTVRALVIGATQWRAVDVVLARGSDGSWRVVEIRSLVHLIT